MNALVSEARAGGTLPQMDEFWFVTTYRGQPVPQGKKSVTFRMRFLHYTGRYVMHCHMLVHEDMGMMQGVTVVGPSTAQG